MNNRIQRSGLEIVERIKQPLLVRGGAKVVQLLENAKQGREKLSAMRQSLLHLLDELLHAARRGLDVSLWDVTLRHLGSARGCY